MARFTVYLPDALRERAVAAELNLSETLRNGVIDALKRRELADDGDTADELADR